MKVIHQLISYFRAHGALTDQQLEHLRSQGFWQDELYETEYWPSEYDYDYDGHEGAHEVDERGNPLEVLRRRRSRGSAPSGRVLSRQTLCRRLVEVSTDWDASLIGLIQLANHWRACDSWRDAILAVRNAKPNELRDVVLHAMKKRILTIGMLSDSLDLQSYRTVLPEIDRQGEVFSAYQAALSTDDYSSLGKYAWVLRYKEIGDIFNLIQAKRKILASLGAIHETNDGQLDTFLRRDHFSSLFWSFVILHNAQTPEHELTYESEQVERKFLVNIPRFHVIGRSGLYAMRMAPSDTLSFFVRYLDPSLVGMDDLINWSAPASWIVPAKWTLKSEKWRRDYF